MNFDEQTIGACSDRSQRNAFYIVASASGVTGIPKHWQMRFFLQSRNGVYIKSEAGLRLKSADAAFAQQDLSVPVSQNIFSGEQKLFGRGAKPTFKQNRLGKFTDCIQQKDILHVSRADLQYNYILAGNTRLFCRHDLRNNWQPRLLSHFSQIFVAFFSNALVRIW